MSRNGKKKFKRILSCIFGGRHFNYINTTTTTTTANNNNNHNNNNNNNKAYTKYMNEMTVVKKPLLPEISDSIQSDNSMTKGFF